MKPLRTLAVLLLPTLLSAQSPPNRHPETLVLAHVSVIDATGSPLKLDMSVVIRDHRIDALVPAGRPNWPQDAQVVDATGKFLIPGLWDMHVHTGQRDIFLPLYIANGVTGVRDMGGDLENGTGELAGLSERYVQLRLWRLAIEQEYFVGPRIVMAGFLIDGFKWPGDISATNPDEGRRAVQVLKSVGVDFVKVKSFLSRDAYFATADEARHQHIVLAGHVPDSVRAAEASDSGQQSIEHLTGVALGSSGEEHQLIDEKAKAFVARDRARYGRVELHAAETFDASVASVLFAKFVKNGTWQVPTLVELRANALGIVNDEAQDHVGWSYLPLSIRDWWTKSGGAGSEGGQQLFASEIALTRKMHAAGVRFLTGTDSPNPSVVPGFSLHDELKLLVTAGFTPMEALQTATLNPARYLGREHQLGTVQTGKLADLVLLDANPLEDISNTQKIRAVVVNGRYLSRQDLDAMLRKVKEEASK